MVAASSAACIVRSARELCRVLSSFDPALLTGEECAEVVRELATVEKAGAAARVVAARRAGECGAHEREGFADAGDWLARHSGSSTGRARADLRTAEALADLPRTAEELRAGRLSLDQANEIAKTERERPGSEAELVDVANKSGLGRLKEHARKKRLEAIDPDELHRRQRAARRFRHWINDLGNVAFSGEITPDVGIGLMNRLDRETDRIRREAKRVATRRGEALEEREAYTADAFVKALTSSGSGPGVRAEVVFVVDLNAYRRGHTHPGEVCQVIGGGPVPVDIVREMANDAFLKVAFHDGVAIHTVTHLGRHIKAELRTALELGEAPDFDGVTCIEDGCERRDHLEWDHVDPIANHGPTSKENLVPRCWPHHRRKTQRDLEAGLLDGRNRSERGPPAADYNDP